MKSGNTWGHGYEGNCNRNLGFDPGLWRYIMYKEHRAHIWREIARRDVRGFWWDECWLGIAEGVRAHKSSIT